MTYFYDKINRLNVFIHVSVIYTYTHIARREESYQTSCLTGTYLLVCNNFLALDFRLQEAPN